MALLEFSIILAQKFGKLFPRRVIVRIELVKFLAPLLGRFTKFFELDLQLINDRENVRFAPRIVDILPYFVPHVVEGLRFDVFGRLRVIAASRK